MGPLPHAGEDQRESGTHLLFPHIYNHLKIFEMKKENVQVLVTQDPVSRKENRQNKFFDRAMEAVPKSAVLICAKGVFGKGESEVSYTYRHAGRIFTTTLRTERGVTA
jgi:hypothetical protein